MPIPTRIITIPEKLDQNIWGISIRRVDAFRTRVNTTTDTERDPITVNAFLETPLLFSSDAPMTMGKSGSMQGARTVNTPARTEITKKITLLHF